MAVWCNPVRGYKRCSHMGDGQGLGYSPWAAGDVGAAVGHVGCMACQAVGDVFPRVFSGVFLREMGWSQVEKVGKHFPV